MLVAGIDGGGLDDLLALAVVGREAETKRWLAWGKSFVHIEGLRRRRAEAARRWSTSPAPASSSSSTTTGPVAPAEILSGWTRLRRRKRGPEAESGRPIPGADDSGQTTFRFFALRR